VSAAPRLVNPPDLLSVPGTSWAGIGDGLVFTAGQVAFDAEGKLVGDGDPAAQAEKALANLDTVLRAAGSGPERLLSLRCYLTDADSYPHYAEARREWLGDHAPAGTVLIISALLDPRLLIEVEAVALAG
jgi:enamine deaminase RidA (YjgF/YER057c/UK114 family)